MTALEGSCGNLGKGKRLPCRSACDRTTMESVVGAHRSVKCSGQLEKGVSNGQEVIGRKHWSLNRESNKAATTEGIVKVHAVLNDVVSVTLWSRRFQD